MWSNNTEDAAKIGVTILNGQENKNPNKFCKIKTRKITRGHDFTLEKEQSGLDVIKYSFSQRTVNE